MSYDPSHDVFVKGERQFQLGHVAFEALDHGQTTVEIRIKGGQLVQPAVKYSSGLAAKTVTRKTMQKARPRRYLRTRLFRAFYQQIRTATGGFLEERSLTTGTIGFHSSL